MKKLVFGLIAIVMFSFVGNSTPCLNLESETSIESELTEKPKIPITISIDFGRKSKGCTGFGVCKIDISLDLEDVFQAVSNGMGGVDVSFGEKGMNIIKQTFNGSAVIIEEDYVLSDNVCEKLEIQKGYTLKAGKYTASKNNDGNYIVKF